MAVAQWGERATHDDLLKFKLNGFTTVTMKVGHIANVL